MIQILEKSECVLEKSMKEKQKGFYRDLMSRPSDFGEKGTFFLSFPPLWATFKPNRTLLSLT